MERFPTVNRVHYHTQYDAKKHDAPLAPAGPGTMDYTVDHHGPEDEFDVNDEDEFDVNKHAWNKDHGVLFAKIKGFRK